MTKQNDMPEKTGCNYDFRPDETILFGEKYIRASSPEYVIIKRSELEGMKRTHLCSYTRDKAMRIDAENALIDKLLERKK